MTGKVVGPVTGKTAGTLGTKGLRQARYDQTRELMGRAIELRGPNREQRGEIAGPVIGAAADTGFGGGNGEHRRPRGGRRGDGDLSTTGRKGGADL
jgi:hypothetical protein